MQVDNSVLEFLKAQGLGDQVKQFEKKYGVNISQLEEALDKFVTSDKDCLVLKDQVRRLALVDDAVLIHGESGTGKELIARALGSNRKSGSFVAINVAALPKDLVESILFGYTAGAFTGASKDKPGLLQHAGEGTLFLDEIGDLSLDLQAKFLRVLQDRKVRRVGSLDEEDVKCRIIAASHHNLYERVVAGEFRLDLYARLSTFELQIKPLRSRITDVPLIIDELKKPNVDYAKLKEINWSKIDLKLNVRSVQQYMRRYEVLGILPTIST